MNRDRLITVLGLVAAIAEAVVRELEAQQHRAPRSIHTPPAPSGRTWERPAA